MKWALIRILFVLACMAAGRAYEQHQRQAELPARPAVVQTVTPGR